MTPSPLPNDPAPPMPIQPGGISTSTGNPVLDEISAAHANLSPQAQQAIEGAHGMLGISPAHSDPALMASAALSPEVAVPGVSGPRGPLPVLSPEIPAPNRMETVGPGSMTGAMPLLPGLREIGNTNLNDRPVLRNTDGSQSTESSTSFGTDKGETLVPTVINGQRLSNADALNAYRQTGQHMGIFDTPENANNYAEGLERSRENEIASQRSGPSAPVAGGSSVGADEMGTHASPPMPITPPMTTAQSELQRRQETGSGVHQFAQNHKLLGIPLQIADAIGSGFFPRFAQFIPGTSAKHNLQDVPQAEREVADEAGQAKSAADVANTNAEAVNRESLPELHKTQAELAAQKLTSTNTAKDADRKIKETEEARKQAEDERKKGEGQQKIAAGLAEHGLKVDPETKQLVPLPYAEMSEPQQAVHDLKGAQAELTTARRDYVTAQKNGIPAAQELARKRVEAAQESAATAAGRLGLSRDEFNAQFLGTAPGGAPLAGGETDEAGHPIGTKITAQNKPGATAQGRASQAESIIEAGNNLKAEIDKHKDKLGNLGSYWNQFANGSPIADPDTARLMAEIASYAALQPAMHGMRGGAVMKEFEKMVGGVPKNPEALKAAIDGIAATSSVMAKQGQPRQGHGNAAQPGGSGTPQKATTQAEYDALPKGTRYVDSNGVAGTKK